MQKKKKLTKQNAALCAPPSHFHAVELYERAFSNKYPSESLKAKGSIEQRFMKSISVSS